MAKASAVFVVIFACILRGLCTNIEVLNKDVIFCRNVGNILELQVFYSDEREYALAAKSSTLCLTVNGKECKCYDSYLTADIIFPSECTVDESHWFAVTVTIPSLSSKSAAISYPLLVPSNNDNLQHDKLMNVSVQSTLVPGEHNNNLQNLVKNMITLVLPVTSDDVSRCVVLFNSLLLVPKGVVFEMLIYVPDNQYDLIKQALEGLVSNLNFTANIISESHLFQRKKQPNAYPYAIQMAIKLLVSRVVKTSYYLTLDADVILLRPLSIDQMLVPLDDGANHDSCDYECHDSILKNSSNAISFEIKALYEHEERHLHHPDWWIGSENILNIPSENPYLQGFGVTPALLSTFGKLHYKHKYMI